MPKLNRDCDTKWNNSEVTMRAVLHLVQNQPANSTVVMDGSDYRRISLLIMPKGGGGGVGVQTHLLEARTVEPMDRRSRRW